jgi:hypothetical protein
MCTYLVVNPRFPKTRTRRHEFPIQSPAKRVGLRDQHGHIGRHRSAFQLAIPTRIVTATVNVHWGVRPVPDNGIGAAAGVQRGEGWKEYC